MCSQESFDSQIHADNSKQTRLVLWPPFSVFSGTSARGILQLLGGDKSFEQGLQTESEIPMRLFKAGFGQLSPNEAELLYTERMRFTAGLQSRLEIALSKNTCTMSLNPIHVRPLTGKAMWGGISIPLGYVAQYPCIGHMVVFLEFYPTSNPSPVSCPFPPFDCDMELMQPLRTAPWDPTRTQTGRSKGRGWLWAKWALKRRTHVRLKCRCSGQT